MMIYCIACEREVNARLTDGAEIYEHRADLADIPFWRCDACGNYVGCHHKTKQRTRPLGYIATPELLAARRKIHELMDPLWQDKLITRGELYAYLRNRLGHEYHTGEIRDFDEVREVLRLVRKLRSRLTDIDKVK